MKVFLQRRVLHLTRTKGEWLRCVGKESFDQTSCWHPRKKTREKELWRHDKREKSETLTTGGVGESLKRVGEKFHISEARAFFIPWILEKGDEQGDDRGSRCSSQIAEDESVYRTDGIMKVIGRKSRRDLIERKNQEEQPGISWLGPSEWQRNILMRGKAMIDPCGSPWSGRVWISTCGRQTRPRWMSTWRGYPIIGKIVRDRRRSDRARRRISPFVVILATLSSSRRSSHPRRGHMTWRSPSSPPAAAPARWSKAAVAVAVTTTTTTTSQRRRRGQ